MDQAISNGMDYKFKTAVAALAGLGLIAGLFWLVNWTQEVRVLRQMVERLSAESRAAEVLVTKAELDESTGKLMTTIKFLEFDTQGKAIPAKYFTFKGNIIQFQSLVIRFEDKFVRLGDKLRGKSAYLFMKAFVLDGAQTQEFEITPSESVPAGYQIQNLNQKQTEIEKKMWGRFWNYALDSKARERTGIKNAQIEAPGTMFLPGMLYTLKIEHDGGLRIDSQAIPEILKGEILPSGNETTPSENQSTPEVISIQ